MNCEKGDLAFIKKSIRPINVGLIVTCENYLGYYLQGDHIEISGEHWIAPISDNYWYIRSSNSSIETQYGKSSAAYIPDLWLTPIKAEPLEDDIETTATLDDEITI